MTLWLLAHPILVRGELPVSAFELALIAVGVLLVVSVIAGRLFRNAAGAELAPATDDLDPPVTGGAGMRTAFWTTRAAGLGLLLLAIAAGLAGSPDQLSNIAPSLIVGAGWPLLVLGSLVLGRVWPWLNPFDTLARAVGWAGAGDGTHDEHPRVAWAALFGALWMGYITVWPTALSPRSVGTVLGVYTLITLAGCLALGRRPWLERGEFFTVFFGLLAGVHRHGGRLTVPVGGGAVCGVVAGAALFGLIRDSDVGTLLAYGPQATGYSLVGVIVVMAVVAALTEALARHGIGAAAGVGMIPAAGGMVLAMALARYRLTTSVQLLPVLASDPFGAGVDLFGTRNLALQARPFDVVTLIWVQASTALAGCAVGVVFARRRAAMALGRRRIDAALAAIALLSVLVGIGVAGIGAF